MFKKADQGFGVLGGTAALSINQALGPAPLSARAAHWLDRLKTLELASDLGAEIGSSQWYRGFATCAALCASAIFLSPGLKPLPTYAATALEGKALDEARAQMILPLAFGSDSGRRMAPTAAVVPTTDTPERTRIDLVATLGQGDGFQRVLERAGVSPSEADRIAAMVSGVAPLADIPAGTTIPIALGARPAPSAPRPLLSLDIRASFDTKLEFRRVGNALQMRKVAITVDNSPVRIQGVIGDGLYLSARAAGVPIGPLEAYIKVIAAKASLDEDAVTGARFDLVFANSRSTSGEMKPGKLLYAGLDTHGHNVKFIEWTVDGRADWYSESGVSESHGGMANPVDHPRLTSGFGMRFHPVLGYSRMHKGVDYGAPYGSPVYAVSDGLVAYAGRYNGYGNHVRVSHSGTLGTSYSHLSRIMVGAGSKVHAGQLLGYVGSTGLSTGPHLHFEVYKNGQAVDPRGVTFAARALLSGAQLNAFRAKMGQLQTVRTSAGAR